MRRIVLLAGLVATALVIGAVYFILVAPPSRPLQVGDKAPDLKLKGAFGGEGKLSDYRGKVVLLNFWATWCSPCVTEMPSLQTLYYHYGADDFEIVAVALDQEGATVVQQFAAANKLEFALVTDEAGLSEEIYRLTGLPETYIIDKEGIIRHKIVGPLDWTQRDNVKLIYDLVGHGPVSKRPATDTTSPAAVTGAAAITAPAEAGAQ